jgi:5'-methylthioadenosine phosphorylase
VGRLAIVGGNSLIGSDIGADAPVVEVRVPETGDAVVVARDLGHAVLLQRHGRPEPDADYTAPHLVSHAANLRALLALGCDRVLAVNSTGGLRAEVGPGTFLAADDFVWVSGSLSTFGDEHGHRVPALDPAWRRQVIDTWRAHSEVPLRDGGVYWQVTGPRLETAAEIRMMATFADVVGMTMAAECVVAGELGLPYASVCIVDNFANGIREQPLTWAEFEAGKAVTQHVLGQVLDVLAPALGA